MEAAPTEVQGACRWTVPRLIGSLQSLPSFQLNPAVRRNKANKDGGPHSEPRLSAERRLDSCGEVWAFWTARRALRRATAVPTLIKWDGDSNTVVTNNRITEITHLTGFDLSLTFRGQLDHVHSFSFDDSWSVLFGFL